MKLKRMFERHMAFILGAHGPGISNEAVIDRLRAAIDEAEKSPASSTLWAPVFYLAVEGMTRAILAQGPTIERAAVLSEEIVRNGQAYVEATRMPAKAPRNVPWFFRRQ